MRKIKELRHQGKRLVYIDETWVDTSYTAKKCWQSSDQCGIIAPFNKGERFIVVHAGFDGGFIDGAALVLKANSTKGDYHCQMNGELFENWMINNLLPNLNAPCVIIMDNASYHSVQSDKCPTSATRKAEIQKWLRDHGFPYRENMLKAELLNIVKLNKPRQLKYRIDTILGMAGHTVVRLPPYHCDLNPIELIWGQLKRKIASRNVTCKTAVVQELIHQCIREITPADWENSVKHVVKIEENYTISDIVIDDAIDDIIIDLRDSSSSSSDDDDSIITDSASETEQYIYDVTTDTASETEANVHDE